MTLRGKFGRMVMLALTATALIGHSHAQVLNSGASTITLQAVLNDSITVALSGNAVNFNLTQAARTIPATLRLRRPRLGC